MSRLRYFLFDLRYSFEEVWSKVIELFFLVIFSPFLLAIIIIFIVDKKARDKFFDVMTYPWHLHYPEFR